MYRYKKRVEYFGRHIYKRKGFTDKQLSIFGVIIGVIQILLVLAMCSMAIYLL